MSQTVFILHNDDNDYIVKQIQARTYINSAYYCENLFLDSEDLISLAEHTTSEYFYVIKTSKEICFTDFDFSFKPDHWDKHYLHMWNNDTTMRLYNKEEVLKDPDKFNDEALLAGRVQLKNINQRIFETPTFDVVFLSYDESFADEHYEQLKLYYPRAKRVSGVQGIYEAHKAAANLVTTDMFYVVDADAVLMPDFRLDYRPHSLDRQSVHVWQSKNPINDLVYGYGGVKLFPTKLLREYSGSPIDFTTSVGKGFKVMDEISNITKFNTDPFSTWRSAFRECVKLSTGLIKNHNNTETMQRLETWCTVGRDREFGDFALMGANEGREFGVRYSNHPDVLRMINNYSWLEERFAS